MQSARVLHRDKRIALEYEPRHTHEHREEVVIERDGRRAEEPRPDLLAGAKAERAADVEFGLRERIDDLPFLEAHDAATIAARQRERRREPVADDGHFRIGIHALAEAGSNVVICSRKLENCETAAHEVEKAGVKALAVGCDVTKVDQVEALKDATMKKFGRVDASEPGGNGLGLYIARRLAEAGFCVAHHGPYPRVAAGQLARLYAETMLPAVLSSTELLV